AASGPAEAIAPAHFEQRATEIAGNVARETVKAAYADDTALRSQLEAHAVAAAERAARELLHQGAEEAEAARRFTMAAADEKLRAALATVHSTVEHVHNETLELAKAAIEDASRQVMESVGSELYESVKKAAEAAAKNVSESAARA